MEMMFENAVRNKYRWYTKKGNVSVEDLWDMNINDLNDIYKELRIEYKNSFEESLLVEAKPNKELESKIEIIKHIVNIKIAEKNAKAVEAEKKQKAKMIDDILAKKEISGLESMSIEELKKKREELNA